MGFRVRCRDLGPKSEPQTPKPELGIISRGRRVRIVIVARIVIMVTIVLKVVMVRELNLSYHNRCLKVISSVPDYGI